MSLRVKFDAKQVEEVLRTLPSKIVVPAVVRALNKAAANVGTAANSAIRKRRSLSASTVRKAMSIRKATRGHFQATLVVTGRPIPLKDYKARQTRKGVTVAVTPGKRKRVSHRGNASFIASNLSGHVFAREGKNRLPIKKLFGPSLPSTFTQEAIRNAWISVARDVMPRRAMEELRFELSKLGPRKR